MLEKINPLEVISTLQQMRVNMTDSKTKTKKCEGCDTIITSEWLGGDGYIHRAYYCDVCRLTEAENREREEKQYKRDRLLEKIPAYYKKMSFDNFKQTEKNIKALQAVKEFLTESNYRGLYIYGTCGAGKTHLAVSVWQELINQFKSVKFIESPELMMMLRKSFDSNADNTDEEIINYFVNTDNLIIDDFGADRTTAFAEDCFYLLLNRRLTQDKHKILITSNKSLKDYSQSVSDRIASRIAEMCKIINLDDVDHRMIKRI